MSSAAADDRCMHECCTAKVVRFEAYAAEGRHGYAVGFSVTCNINGATVYMDTVVYPQAGDTDAQVTAAAWSQLADAMRAWFLQSCARSQVIGSEFAIPAHPEDAEMHAAEEGEPAPAQEQ
jgi:hypothetical protein